MFGSTLLDIAIGLIFVYLLLSLICSALNEIIEAWLKKRATDLERGIAELLLDRQGTGVVRQLYKHPLISGLFKGEYESSLNKKWWSNIISRTTLPSYIPARNFALALMDTILPSQSNTLSGAAGATVTPTVPAATAGATVSPTVPPAGAPIPNPLRPLRDAVGKITNKDLQRALMALLDAAGNDVSKARENIEAWYNSSMERLTGWYKRRAQFIILVLGLGVVIAVNADTIAISTSLSSDKTVRDSLIAAAQEYVKQPPEKQEPDKPMKRIEQYMDLVRNQGLPLGWNTANPLSIPDKTKPDISVRWLLKIVGWLITTLAISLGAPFWFDLLNKFVAVRSSMKPKEKSPEEAKS